MEKINDILPDGLPRILLPYENGVLQAVLTLPEAYIALGDVAAAIIYHRQIKSQRSP